MSSFFNNAGVCNADKKMWYVSVQNQGSNIATFSLDVTIDGTFSFCRHSNLYQMEPISFSDVTALLFSLPPSLLPLPSLPVVFAVLLAASVSLSTPAFVEREDKDAAQKKDTTAFNRLSLLSITELQLPLLFLLLRHIVYQRINKSITFLNFNMVPFLLKTTFTPLLL